MSARSAHANPIDDTGQQFIDGRRRRGSSSLPLTVTNPSSGEVVATDMAASAADVDDAVAAAKVAFLGWAAATPAERSTLMHRLAAELNAVAAELAGTESRQCGKPIRLADGLRRAGDDRQRHVLRRGGAQPRGQGHR